MNKIKVVLTLIRLSIDIKNTILQWNLSKVDTIGTRKWYLIYGIVRFIEIAFKRI